MSTAHNIALVLAPIDRAVQLHEDGVRAWQANQDAAAEAMLGEALALFTQHDGEDSLDAAVVLCDLGVIREEQCDYATAEKYFHRAVAIAAPLQHEAESRNQEHQRQRDDGAKLVGWCGSH